jgi:hypothetical protein
MSRLWDSSRPSYYLNRPLMYFVSGLYDTAKVNLPCPGSAGGYLLLNRISKGSCETHGKRPRI